MTIIKNKKSLLMSSLFGLSLIFTGCAKDQIIMETFSPPKKQQEVKQMLAVSDLSNGFLKLEVVDDIQFITNNNQTKDKVAVANKLLADIKKYITQTNFISISDIADDSQVSLDMKIIRLDYQESGNKISGLVEVEFNIRKGEPIYTQTYKREIKRQSRAGRQALPSKAEILSEASQYLAKKLIKDISPISTKKLVELKSAPDGLEHTISYAKAGNFKQAIKAMEGFKGDKDEDFYFNLAVFYEALGSKNDNMALFEKAHENYNLAIENGGSDDDIILNGKSKFDKFYEIIQKVAKQKLKNAEANSSSQFEILD